MMLVNSRLLWRVMLVVMLFSGQAFAAYKPSDFISDLANVPGVDGLEFVNYDTSTKILKVKLWGKNAKIQKFKIDGNKYYSIVPKEVTLSHILPLPNNAVIDDLVIDNSAIIYVPSGSAEITADLSDLSSEAQESLANHTSGVGLQRGFNLFTDLEVKGLRSFKNLLKKGSVFSTQLTTSVVLPDDILSADTGSLSSSAAKAWLNSIDMQIQVPGSFRIPHLKRVKKISRPKLSLTFVDGDAEQPKVSLTEDIDINLVRSKLTFTLSKSIMLADAKYTPTFDATSDERLRLKLLNEKVYADNVTMQADLSRTDWNIQVSATAEINDQPYAIELTDIGRDASVKVPDGATIEQLWPDIEPVAGLTNVALTNIELTDKILQGQAMLFGALADITAFSYKKKPYLAIQIASINDVEAFMPASKDTPLAGTRLENVHLIFIPGSGTLKVSGLPKHVSSTVKDVDLIKYSTKFNQGLNVVATAVVNSKSGLHELFDELAIKSNDVPLVGSLDPIVLQTQQVITSAGKRQFIDEIQLFMPLAKIKSKQLINRYNLEANSLPAQSTNAVMTWDKSMQPAMLIGDLRLPIEP